MKKTTIYFPPELLARLKKHSEKTSVPLAAFLRRAAEVALKRAESKQ